MTARNRPASAGDTDLPEATAPPPPAATPKGWLGGQWPYLVPATVGAATAAWILGALSGRAHDGARLWLILAGAALTAVAVGLPLRQHRQAVDAQSDAVSAAQAARVAMRVALQDALDPFVHLVTRLTEARAADKPRLRGEAIQLAVATLAALAGPERVRVCFFVLEPGPPATLRPERFAGRSGAPTAIFVEGTAAGDAALRILARGVWTYVEDTAATPSRFGWDVAPAYRTFLAGPVATAETRYGLLTLDSLGPGELADVDLALLQLLSGLLAAALSV